MSTIPSLSENTAPDGTDVIYSTDGTNDEKVQIKNLLKGSGAEVPAAKITVPTGLHIHAAYMSQRITPSPANPISGSINITGTGVTETISYGYLGSEAVDSMILSISGVLIGETAGGTVEVDYVKAADVYSTTYQGGESHVICRRILG
jgi:hypothetical protein